MTRDEFLDLLERIFMPLQYAQRKRMTPETDAFVESMKRFRSRPPEIHSDRPCEHRKDPPSAAERGATALRIVVAVWVSFMSAGSGCVTDRQRETRSVDSLASRMDEIETSLRRRAWSCPPDRTPSTGRERTQGRV